MFKRADMGQTDTPSWLHSRTKKRHTKNPTKNKKQSMKIPQRITNFCWSANNSSAANRIRGVFNITQRLAPPLNLSCERGLGSDFTARQARLLRYQGRRVTGGRGAARVLSRKIHQAPTARDAGGSRWHEAVNPTAAAFSESPSST